MSGGTTLRNGLLVLAAALLVGLGWVSDWGRGLGKPDIALPDQNSQSSPPGVLPDFSLGVSADAYPQIATRPLLNPSRKPAPTELAQAPAEPVQPRIRRGLYQLLGVTGIDGNRYALLRESSTSKTRSVKVGDSLQEMKVKEISATGVVLEYMGEVESLELAKFTASGRVPQLPAPPPPVAAAAQAGASGGRAANTRASARAQAAAQQAAAAEQPAADPAQPAAAGTAAAPAEQQNDAAAQLEQRRAARRGEIQGNAAPARGGGGGAFGPASNR